MRYQTCVTCQCPGSLADNGQRIMVMMNESSGLLTHHHHIVKCGLCGAWWFDDIVAGDRGRARPARRDTQMCSCPEGQPVYTPVAVSVPGAEASCVCTKKSIEETWVQAEAWPADIGPPSVDT